ncbi:TetR/AcrR family transcriptional regulator [Pediococcus pentosaceus]|uniref:TetR/AcrR family transcriptional regulator n=1 Tax=Pediococcus pentosaceus TaxID=1255 RepID=UPI001326FC55|nr:TetR/AcrR family transcriptional regulator [Pediococcus pentosaceus]KAF0521481.1 TetR family transcriptional regulator [Pediococcus pentosaceus]MBF7138784.1 TetR/AcrR family transcriptional regulator [Pediococcus pentosaceus]
MNIQKTTFKKTDEKIITALVDIGQDKPLSKITVSDITKLLKINRGTFYLHYSDKEELVNTMEGQLNKAIRKKLVGVMDELLVLNFSNKKSFPHLLDLFHFLNANKKKLKWLVGPTGDPNFMDTIKDILKNNLLVRVKQLTGTQTFIATIPDRYVIHIVISGIIDIIEFWLKEEDSLSEKEISDILVNTRVLSPYRLLNL